MQLLTQICEFAKIQKEHLKIQDVPKNNQAAINNLSTSFKQGNINNFGQLLEIFGQGKINSFI